LTNDCLTALRNARALIFDFDGTLVQSNNIKWRGFEVAFADFPERLPEIMAYCRGQHHTMRTDKFRYVYEHILRLPYTAEVEHQLHVRFAAATTQAIINAEEVRGSSAFLRRIPERYETGLLSSTPHEVLLDILGRRGIREYFGVIQGAPVNKASWLGTFRRERALSAEQTIFFGDTADDMRSAQVAGCTFVGVGEPDVFAAAQYAIEDFRNIDLTHA